MTFRTQIDFFTEVARGNVAGWSHVHQLGYNDDVDTLSSPETVWNSAPQPMLFLSAAETMYLISDDVADTAAGTGARTVCITGLDSSFDEIKEIVTLNGLTPVTSVNSYLRIQHVFVVLSGSNESNVGTITMDPSVSGAPARQATIDPDRGEDGNTCFTVPNNFDAFMAHLTVGVNSREGTGGIKEARVELYKRLPGESWRIVKMYSSRSDGSSASPDLSHTTPEFFPPMTDIRSIADADVSNPSVNVMYDMVLISNL